MRFKLLLCLFVFIAAAVGTLAAPQARAVTPVEIFTFDGESATDNLGRSATWIGDMNGDGLDDVVVGANLEDEGGVNAGKAYVFFGNPMGDAQPDLILPGAASADYFGWSVAGAGDVNGDGYDDVIVGAYLDNGGDGSISVYFGGASPDSLADLTVHDPEGSSSRFGTSVAGVGDMNGDGYDDFLVGSPFSDAVALDSGRAYVFFGSAVPDTVADLILEGNESGGRLGFVVAGPGDVNGNGYDDALVGAPYEDLGGVDRGRAYLYFGGDIPDALSDFSMAGEEDNDRLGQSVSGAGDIDDDGYNDLIIGVPGSDAGAPSAGQAYVYFGDPELENTPEWIVSGVNTGDGLGSAVASAGDVNGDGSPDLAVGIPSYDTEFYFGVGAVRIYFTGAALDTVADLVLVGEHAADSYGTVLDGGGDFDGDGSDDFIVATRFRDVNGTNSGRLYVYGMYAYRFLSMGSAEAWVPGQSATVRWRGPRPADLDLSVDGGLSWTRLATGVGGLTVNEYTVTAPGTITEYAMLRLTYTGEIPGLTNSQVGKPFRIVAPAPNPSYRQQWIADGESSFDSFGYSASSAGDMNGDGFDDVVVGAVFNNGGGFEVGRAYVYYGGPASDGVPDLILNGEADEDRFGISVSSAGDMNGDGYGDIVVGASGNDAGGGSAGRAYVYFGGAAPDAVADLTFTGAADDILGLNVAGAGDVNGDGYSDVVVGAVGHSSLFFFGGRAYVYFGGPGADNTPDWTLDPESGNEDFSRGVSSAGDVNGDGYDDVLVGAPDAGKVYVFYGGQSPDSNPDLFLEGETDNDGFGYAVSAAGDMNGDGFGDMLVGAFGNDSGGPGAGRAYVFYGGPGEDGAADLVFTGEASGDQLGWAVSAGDLNADGFGDAVVGAYTNSAAASAAGRVYVFHGGPGIDEVPDAVFTGQEGGANFGSSVDVAGDVTGDGFQDLVIGERDGNVGFAVDAGKAYLYNGNRHHVLSPQPGAVWNVGGSESISWSGEALADVWLSTNGGDAYNLLESEAGGNPVNSLSLTVPHQPTKFAKIKVTPSDPELAGSAKSDSLFTIEASVALLNLLVTPVDGGGVLLSWDTEPGSEDLMGYKVERARGASESWQLLVAMTREMSYRDPSGSEQHRYRLTAVNGLGEELLLGETDFTPAVPLSASPLPYPGGELEISFLTAGGLGGGAASARVALYDVNGRLVRVIAEGAFEPGHQVTHWDGRDSAGRSVANGVYFLRTQSGGETATLKLVISR